MEFQIFHKVNYYIIGLAFVLIITEFIGNYISQGIFFHCLCVLGIIAIINLVTSRIKRMNKLGVKILICIFIIFVNYNYSQFLYKIDSTILIVPENFTGNVEILFGSQFSNISVKPYDNHLIMKINKGGRFETRSKYKIALNAILVVELKNRKVNFAQKLSLRFPQFIDFDTLSTKMYKLTGKVIRR